MTTLERAVKFLDNRLTGSEAVIAITAMAEFADQLLAERDAEIERDIKHQLILLAWEAGEISEGQVMKALGRSRIEVRGIRDVSVEAGIKAMKQLEHKL